MQPVKITIYGDYYDCQIYRGRLYLWTFDGVLNIYNWEKIVKFFIKNEKDDVAMTYSFLGGNYLYQPSLIKLFKDTDFKKMLLSKFTRIQECNFELTEVLLAQFLLGQQDTPTKTLPTDTEIYGNKLYFIHEKGLYASAAHKPVNNKYLVSTRPTKLWDCNLLSIKANKYPQLALSGADEGLFELNMAMSVADNLKQVDSRSPIFQISEEHSSFSNYSYLSIYNSSLTRNSFFDMFKWTKKNHGGYEEYSIRNFDKSIRDQELFGVDNREHFISWGIDDKLYKATTRGFEIIRYNPFAKVEKGQLMFTPLNSINFDAWKGRIVNGGTTYFANIVECENALFIITSDQDVFTIEGEITRWRVYPRSRNYENHLHVILDDRIEIYSFNQDYFVNQDAKEIGIKFSEEKQKSTR